MAWMSQENKAGKLAKIKPLLAEYGMKGTLSVHHGSTLYLTLQSGPLDPWEDKFVDPYAAPGATPLDYQGSGGHMEVSRYYLDRKFVGRSLEFFEKAFKILDEGNHDRSDSMSDYFDVGWYTYIRVGRWEKPYKLTAAPATKAPKGWEVAETSTEEQGEAGEAGASA